MYWPVESCPVTVTLYVPALVTLLLLTERLTEALPPAARLGEALSKEQPMPPVLVQLRLTAPLKLLVEVRLRTSDALPEEGTVSVVFSGMRVKSESGLESGLAMVTADGA